MINENTKRKQLFLISNDFQNKRSMKMKKIFLPAIIVIVMALTGCNTFKGMGKDIEDAGHGIQKASDKTKEAITK
jgi:predicted small secreted protein